ncbi:MAG TPA: SGNH/GDSL hydrolase family protein [Candidatus Udaeobacter sp.]|jgi:lysophospholipase L1-like esterase|nr:SGNH/GDSL hydrolase family protein [Candidatus Udaeobacter sp.]
MRILALGDSYTIGESVTDAERWPVQLARRLRERGVDVADPEIIARTGWTTSELDHGIDEASPQGTFDLITLLIGVNDQFRGHDAETYRPGFRALLARAVRFAGGEASRVIVLSIPDWGVTPFAEGRDRAAIAAAIDRFNHVNAEETKRAGARYVDVTPDSRAAATDPSLLAADGLHPSAKMHATWALQVLPEAQQVLDAGKH